MIKVIRHGKINKRTCSNCGCEFTFEKSDTDYVQTGPNEYERYINCPDCEERIRVET